jgi:addiction module HigA family antidote
MAKTLKPIHPGEVLREEFLVPLKMSAGALAKACGLPRTRIERITSEQTGITADTALRLAKALGTTAQLWLNLQNDCDIQVAKRDLGKSLDRIEMVELSGYTSLEKLAIAKNHLVPKQLGEHGITREQLELDEEALTEIIHSYTREAGVRNLEREIAAVCRGAAVRVAEGQTKMQIFMSLVGRGPGSDSTNA